MSAATATAVAATIPMDGLRPVKRMNAVYVKIRDYNDHNNARVICMRRTEYYRNTNNRAALELLPSISIIPVDMSFDEYEDIMKYITANNIPRSEYAQVFRSMHIARV